MRTDILTTFRKWLHIEDEDSLDIIIASALGSLCPGDPLWTLVIAPPGGGKTEVVRALNGPHVYPLDTITSKTLVSGLREKGKKETYGILPDLDGKLLVIKDLTVMLQQSAARGDETVFAQLRSAYDGEYSAAHGSGHKLQHYKATFGIVAAVTPIVDRYRALNSSLGERFISVRIEQNPTASIRKAQENSGREAIMRAELQDIMLRCLEHYDGIINSLGIPVLPDAEMEKIRDLGDVTAKLRTEVERDRFRNVAVSPGLEVGTRLVKQLTRLGEMLRLYEAYDYRKVTRVARDSMSSIRLSVAKAIYNSMKVSPRDIHKKCQLNYSTVREDCEDLWMMGLCDREEKGNSAMYSFKPEVMDLVISSELF